MAALALGAFASAAPGLVRRASLCFCLRISCRSSLSPLGRCRFALSPTSGPSVPSTTAANAGSPSPACCSLFAAAPLPKRLLYLVFESSANSQRSVRPYKRLMNHFLFFGFLAFAVSAVLSGLGSRGGASLRPSGIRRGGPVRLLSVEKPAQPPPPLSLRGGRYSIPRADSNGWLYHSPPVHALAAEELLHASPLSHSK